MELSPEWVGVVLTALGSGGAVGVWIDRRVQEARSHMPIIRTDWSEGSEGYRARIEIVNRLDEDLFVERAEADTDFVETIYAFDDGGSIAGHSNERYASPRTLHTTVPPRGSAKFLLSVAAGGSRRITLTLSSSNRTLRSKRVTLRPSQKL